jgi:hypothetical protein
MSDDLRNVGPAFQKLREDMERIGSSVRPSYMDLYEQIERALRPIQQHHLGITRMVAISDLTSARITKIVKAYQHWQGLIEQATVSSRMFAGLDRIHETWAKNLKPMQDQIAQIQAAAKLSLGGIAYRLTVSERLFAGLDFDAIRRAVAASEPSIHQLQDAIANMTATYGELAESIRSYPDLTQLPDYVLPGATREVFVTGHAVGALCASEMPDEDDEASQIQLATEVKAETSMCIGLLQALDPGLAIPYLGAHEALGGGNPDRVRHILSSLRELWNHVLWRIAPDDHVLAWLPGDSKGLLHEGRPTRKSRFLYVCRNLNHPPLADFIDQDTRALVKLVEFFNRVHELKPNLTDEQLRALLLRTDSWLTYILQIWEGSSGRTSK